MCVYSHSLCSCNELHVIWYRMQFSHHGHYVDLNSFLDHYDELNGRINVCENVCINKVYVSVNTCVKMCV